MQVPEQQPSASQAQFVPAMYMPYIEGPVMDWIVNDGLYHRFLKWKLKCEIILDCVCVCNAPRVKEVQESYIIEWWLGVDQYVSWCLPTAELNLETIWPKYEDICKPQANEVWARFVLLSSFHRGDRSVDEWYSGVQAQVSPGKYPQETENILHHDIFWFFLKDEEFVSVTINDSTTDLDNLPASKGRQHAKEMGVWKATVWHIKQVASDPQASQINMMTPQQTFLPPGKCKKKAIKSRSQSYKWSTSEQQAPPYKRRFDPKQAHKSKDRCSKCGDSKHIEGFKCPAMKYQCKSWYKYGHFTSLCFKKQVAFKSKAPKVHQLQAEEIYSQDDSVCGQSEDVHL